MKPRAVILVAVLTLWGPGAWTGLAQIPESETVQGRDDFQEKAEQGLERLDHQLDRLERKLDAARGEVRTRLQHALEELRKQRAVVRRRLDELGSSGEGKWKELRDRIERDLEDLRKQLEKTEDEDAPLWT